MSASSISYAIAIGVLFAGFAVVNSLIVKETWGADACGAYLTGLAMAALYVGGIWLVLSVGGAA